LKQRCGLPKKALERNVRKALESGISHNDCTGDLRRYLDWTYRVRKNADNIKLYGNHMYLFKHEKLVTVIQLPNNFKGQLKKLVKRQQGSQSDCEQ